MIQCETCSKEKVCKYQEECKAAVELINDLNFEFPVKIQIVCEEYQAYAGTVRTIPLPFEPISKEWVKPTEITCGKTFESKDLVWNSEDFTSD